MVNVGRIVKLIWVLVRLIQVLGGDAAVFPLF